MRRVLLCIAIGAGLLVSRGAHAQSSPSLATGQVPTAAQWNSFFAAKVDTSQIGSSVAPLVGGKVPSSNLPSATNSVAGILTLGQAGGSSPVQSVAGRTGAITLGVGDVSGAFPTASAGPLATQAGATPNAAVNAALGFTPYSAANPSGFVNPAGAASAAPVQSVAGLTGAPTAAQMAAALSSQLLPITGGTITTNPLNVNLGGNTGTTSTSVSLSTVPAGSPLPTGTMPNQFWPVTGAAQAVYGQTVANCSTSRGSGSQEYCMNFNMIDGTGGGGAAITNTNQKVGLFGSVIMVPGGANAWAFNPDIVAQSGVGNYPFFNTEFDLTNFNQDYPVGGQVSASQFINFLSAYPVTAAIYSAATTNGGVFATHDFILANGANLVKDNLIYDGTSANESINIAGTHSVGIGTTQGTMTYAAAFGAGQQVCFNALADCFEYTTGTSALTYATTAGNALTVDTAGDVTALASVVAPLVYAPGTTALNLGNATHGTGLTVLDAGGTLANHINIQPATAGFGPGILAVGSDTNINLNLYGKGTGSVAMQSPLAATQGEAVTGNSTISGYVAPTQGVIVAPNYLVPTTGTTITLTASTPNTILNPAGTLAALTIALPTSPINGQVVRYTSTQAITSLTLSSGGIGIIGNMSSLAAYTPFSFEYVSSASAWIRD